MIQSVKHGKLTSRLCQLLFCFSVIGSCWLAMMAFHELGHVLGAVMTGGQIQQVILHPLTISSTTVSPNPNPSLVVWLGPLIGCLVPMLIAWLGAGTHGILEKSLRFFAGFCLIANGAYIGFGSIRSAGDCKEMYLSGTPQSVMILFGFIAMTLGLYHWHKLGSLKEFLEQPQRVPASAAWISFALVVILLLCGMLFSPTC